MKTILVTGCSSGFGLETAKLFLDRGWKVIATMRTIRDDVLPKSPNLRVIALDVSDEASIAAAIKEAGEIDALVNNAGIGFVNAFAGTSMTKVREIFETNTFGTMAMTQAILPQFRARKSGVIVNVTSSVTLLPLRLLSVYTASKAAVNGFTESLALELQQFGVRAHVVLPGRSPETKFGENARASMAASPIPEAYTDLFQSVMTGWQQDKGPVTNASDVAEAIWTVVTDAKAPTRLAAGADAVALSKAA